MALMKTAVDICTTFAQPAGKNGQKYGNNAPTTKKSGTPLFPGQGRRLKEESSNWYGSSVAIHPPEDAYYHPTRFIVNGTKSAAYDLWSLGTYGAGKALDFSARALSPILRIPLVSRTLVACHPVGLLARLEQFNLRLEGIGNNVLKNYEQPRQEPRLSINKKKVSLRRRTGTSFRAKPHRHSSIRKLCDFAVVLSIKTIVGVNRALIQEVSDCTDITNFADHMGFFNSNPIPDYYYVMGDSHRYSCFYLGGENVKPYATADDIITIKGRFAVLKWLYSFVI